MPLHDFIAKAYSKKKLLCALTIRRFLPFLSDIIDSPLLKNLGANIGDGSSFLYKLKQFLAASVFNSAILEELQYVSVHGSLEGKVLNQYFLFTFTSLLKSTYFAFWR